MSDYRHAGIGFPNGAVDNATVFALPSPDLLMLATEGRYHHDEAIRAGKRVLWRAIPRIGKRPAELGWSPSRFVSEAINLTDAPGLPITDFIWANELDLQGERGDGADDWSGLEQRYALIGGWARSVVAALRQWSQSTRLHWPAWTPDHDALGYLDSWREAANTCQVIDFHAYDSLAKIEAQYSQYRAAFPDKPLALTEWHCKGDVAEERRVLQWIADTMAGDPLFDAAYFFIWRWWDHPGWWSDVWDIEHSTDRLALFQNPPLAAVEPSQPDQPQPDEPEPTMPDFPLGIDVSNNNGGIDWPAVRAAGVQFAIAKATEGVNFADRFFAGNWPAMRANGIVRGAYHFARPSANDPVAEARFFWNTIKDRVGDLEAGDLLALDLEDDRVGAHDDLGAWTLWWLQEVERLASFKPLCYTSPGYAQQHGLANRPEIGDYGLWLASWGVPTPPQAPAPWSLVAIHQTGVGPAGTISGVVGEIDLNRYNGPLDTLRLYGKPATAPSPAPEYSVGGGILAAMAAHGDSPASDEVYVAHGDRDAWSEAYGASGARYVWLPSVGRVFRHDPAA